jgi:hypothetical protein
MEEETPATDTGASFFEGGASGGETSDALTSPAAADGATSPELPNGAKQTAGGDSTLATDEQKAEAEAKSSEQALATAGKVTDAAKDINKLKPGYGGLTGLLDAYGSGKAAIEAARNGDFAGLANNGVEALGAAGKAIGPAWQKLAPSVLPSVARALGPAGIGASIAPGLVDAGESSSRSNETLQRQYKLEGSANADGSPTSILDSVRNTGDQAKAAVTNATGIPWLGSTVGVTTKVIGAVGNSPLLIGSAGVGAAKGAWNYGKKLLGGLGDG